MQLLSAPYEPSRHDAGMLGGRSVPADPYAMWVDKREADRRVSVAAELTTPYGRFLRNEPMSWAVAAS
jgi:hypothetical protein